ncbi:elongation factor P maturation arginine rhamnosyltransferase EarP [Taylorella equigenitalis]|uniref:Protein-arginine rhamnosyltransferase n=1 Tax=Taylorella equigenitalis ATCC 35865 TaxID=743973 RepID=A0ABM5N9T8_9BURK|nr:elongation factor P maturation arginine rhamnosyltransferase EarP [Taylorella equigenitalis]AFN35695.1 hypothetical protein KUI_0612 [Taylorella equigenitalis ATCC 35865]ASY30342.1 hypothetical protein B9Z30_02945 [Taylorella equigenitalis]ASY39115.1 hypothetical protein CA604_03045 [Taylorella equigenitalis]KOS58357.1 hypothetical protein AM589_07255 [Taylorella equigenitalis]VEG30731.1 Uncharacterized protein conserved in bacteria [Taylorella equigenitalis ATCC 35865]
MTQTPTSIDIFCNVIDNYGDIGVSWRLSKALPLYINPTKVRFFTNKKSTFKTLVPKLNEKNIVVEFYEDLHDAKFQDLIPADLVIEAFGCDLPQTYIKNMPSNTKLWINLEYISAEKWIESYHLMPSIQKNGVKKFFFMPGFTAKSGGLLHADLSNCDFINDEFSNNSCSKSLLDWISEHIGESLSIHKKNGDGIITIFTYPQAPISRLIEKIQSSKLRDKKIAYLIPKSVFEKSPCISKIHLNKNHQIYVCDFVPHSDFDYLLRVGNLNIVRGEDSMVRAIWNHSPFLWNIYPQTEDTHLKKLEAWLEIGKFSDDYKKATLSLNNPKMPIENLVKYVESVFEDKNVNKEFDDFRDYCQNKVPNLCREIKDFFTKITQNK